MSGWLITLIVLLFLEAALVLAFHNKPRPARGIVSSLIIAGLDVALAIILIVNHGLVLR